MAPNYGPKIPRNDISLFFDPGSVKSYPGSGSTIFDLSGNGNNGALSGSPVFSNGQMVYDGVDDHITVTANQTSLDFTNEQTIIIWMYHNNISGFPSPYDQAFGGYGTWTHEAGNYINYYYGTSGINDFPYTNRSSASTPALTWQMMATTRSISTINWYRNGVLSNTAANAYGATGTTTADIRFGLGYTGRWTGNMGPMMLYKRAITADEMLAIFDAFRGRYGL